MPDTPRVVLVHGLASSFDHGWRQTGWVDLLEDEGREVVELDLPGHGSSDRDPGSPTADAVLAAVDGLGPVDAVGFSAGAQAVLAAAVKSPKTFRRLALLGIGNPNPAASHGRQQIAAALESGDEAVDPFARVIRRLVNSTGNDVAAVATMLRAQPGIVDLEPLTAVTCPTLIVLGDKDMVGPADRLLAALPDATLTVLSGVDHFSTPSDLRCIDAVLRFLAT